jgi:hypothetical protein
MSNYAAEVVELKHIREHTNADRLQIATIFGNSVVVGKEAKIGDTGLFFPVESQLSEQFAVANDLIRRKDEDGKPAGGFFEANRRVRAMKLRGEKSMGFFIGMESLDKTFTALGKNIPTTKIGDSFEVLDGVPICNKYVIPSNNKFYSKQGKSAKKTESRIIPNQFYFHFETSQLGKNIGKIMPDNLIAVTWKMHGTSFVVGHVMVKRKLSIIDKIAKIFGASVRQEEYDYLYSSRRVIKNDRPNSDSSIWTHVGENYFKGLLKKGETVYGEIVGYTPDNSQIQPPFDYGCSPGKYKIYIYRITQTNADGQVFELPWNQVGHRAKELCLETAPAIYYGYAKDMFDIAPSPDFSQRFFDTLKQCYVYDQDSIFCKNKVPEEGVVVRIEYGSGIENLKLKSYRFLEWETKQLDNDKVNMEDIEN